MTIGALRVPVFVVLTALAAGCTSPSATPPPPPAPRARDVAGEAMAAVEAADWPRAAALLREALTQEPGRLRLHYSLAIAASHLGLREEAVREFQWVLANVAAELPEAQVARRWLVEAGVLAPPTADAGERLTEETIGNSGVRGQVVWADGKPTSRVQLFLKGVAKTPTADLQYVLRTDNDGRFEFRRIPAGTYMLTNRIAGRPTWRLRVRLAPGELTTLELGEANSARVRDDFPGT